MYFLAIIFLLGVSFICLGILRYKYRYYKKHEDWPPDINGNTRPYWFYACVMWAFIVYLTIKYFHEH